jgi:hypothetical protein
MFFGKLLVRGSLRIKKNMCLSMFITFIQFFNLLILSKPGIFGVRELYIVDIDEK